MSYWLAPILIGLSVLSLFLLVDAAAAALIQLGVGADGPALHGAIVVDRFSLFFTFLLLAVTGAVIVATADWAADLEDRGEFYALLLVAVGSMILDMMSDAGDRWPQSPLEPDT